MTDKKPFLRNHGRLRSGAAHHRHQENEDYVDVDEAASRDDEANLMRALFTDLGASYIHT